MSSGADRRLSGVLPGPVVVVSAPAAALLVRALDVYARVEGVPQPRHVRNLRADLLSVARAHSGTAEHDLDADDAVSMHDRISTSDAAEVLGCTREYVGRLARAGGLGPTGVDRGRRWLSRTHLDAFAATLSSEET